MEANADNESRRVIAQHEERHKYIQKVYIAIFLLFFLVPVALIVWKHSWIAGFSSKSYIAVGAVTLFYFIIVTDYLRSLTEKIIEVEEKLLALKALQILLSSGANEVRSDATQKFVELSGTPIRPLKLPGLGGYLHYLTRL